MSLDRRFFTILVYIFFFQTLISNCNTDDKITKDPASLDHRFFKAIDKGSIQEVESCLAEGISIDRKDARGNSALIHAVDHENMKLAQLLMERGANVNLRNLVGETALYRAVFRGNLGLVKYLIEKGAETKIKNVEGISPAHLAEDRGEETILHFIENSKK